MLDQKGQVFLFKVHYLCQLITSAVVKLRFYDESRKAYALKKQTDLGFELVEGSNRSVSLISC